MFLLCVWLISFGDSVTENASCTQRRPLALQLASSTQPRGQGSWSAVGELKWSWVPTASWMCHPKNLPGHHSCGQAATWNLEEGFYYLGSRDVSKGHPCICWFFINLMFLYLNKLISFEQNCLLLLINSCSWKPNLGIEHKVGLSVTSGQQPLLCADTSLCISTQKPLAPIIPLVTPSLSLLSVEFYVSQLASPFIASQLTCPLF